MPAEAMAAVAAFTLLFGLWVVLPSRLRAKQRSANARRIATFSEPDSQ